MIQNIKKTQSRQNFGMAAKFRKDFQQRMAQACERKSLKEMLEMRDTLDLVINNQKNVRLGDLHIDFDQKNRLKPVFENKATGRMETPGIFAQLLQKIIPDTWFLELVSYNIKRRNTKYMAKIKPLQANGSLLV